MSLGHQRRPGLVGARSAQNRATVNKKAEHCDAPHLQRRVAGGVIPLRLTRPRSSGPERRDERKEDEMTSDDMDAQLTALARRWADDANWFNLPGIGGRFDPAVLFECPGYRVAVCGTPDKEPGLGLGHPASPRLRRGHTNQLVVHGRRGQAGRLAGTRPHPGRAEVPPSPPTMGRWAALKTGSRARAATHRPEAGSAYAAYRAYSAYVENETVMRLRCNRKTGRQRVLQQNMAFPTITKYQDPYFLGNLKVHRSNPCGQAHHQLQRHFHLSCLHLSVT
jgi:hypothetical protein